MSLEEDIRFLTNKITHYIENDKRILIITHADADGIVAGSIMAKTLIRKAAKFTLRVVGDMNDSLIKSVESKYDFYIITDLGAGFVNRFEQAFGDNWVVIDHHQLPEEEKDKTNVLNVWKYNINGALEISAGGLCYLVSEHMDPRNKDLSYLAVVSALADRQDQGEKRSLLGLNKKIEETARSLGLLSIDLDLMLIGRESKAIHESLAYTPSPYIEGLTWNPSACLSLLSNTGIKLKENGRWRVLAELSEEEKRMLIESIARFVSLRTDASRIIEELIGYIYILQKEDSRSKLRDGREFSTLLNACARVGKAGVGIGICLGDRNSMLREGEMIINEYKGKLSEYMVKLTQDRWRLVDRNNVILVNGENLIEENMLGAVSSLLSSSITLRNKVIVVWTRTKEGNYKFSCRRGMESLDVNLGLVMRECAMKVGGNGGGHAPAAGALIPGNKLNEFLEHVNRYINEGG